MKKIIFTLDLEADHAGEVAENYSLWQQEKIKFILEFFKKNKIPLSVFVVAKSIKGHEDIIELFKSYQLNFYLHTHQQLGENSDFPRYLAKAQDIFKDYFGYGAPAYRAPAYKIIKADLKALRASGIKVDSSCLRSWQSWPNFFISNRFFKKQKIKELFPTVLKPLMIPNSLSWQKLIGFNFFKVCFKMNNIFFLKKDLPQVYVFHLHDLWKSSVFSELDTFWQFIYSRNNEHGLEYLERFVSLLKEENYKFESIEDYLC